MKTIVWDVDDVLNNLTKEWLEREWAPNHPRCKINYESITKNPPHDLLGTTKEKYLFSLDKFRFSKYSQLKPIPEVLDWFKEYGDKCRHFALTSTPLATAPISAEWTIRNYGNWIRTFSFIPSKRINKGSITYDRKKSEYLQYFSEAEIFVDDSMKNSQSVAEVGLINLIFPRPWNNSNKTITETLNRLTELISA